MGLDTLTTSDQIIHTHHHHHHHPEQQQKQQQYARVSHQHWFVSYNILIMPRPDALTHYKISAGVCLSVCLSRASRTERPMKPKIGTMEVYHNVNQSTRFPSKRTQRNRLRCVRCVNENRKKRKRLIGCFDDWLFWSTIPIGWRLRALRLNGNRALVVIVNASAAQIQFIQYGAETLRAEKSARYRTPSY